MFKLQFFHFRTMPFIEEVQRIRYFYTHFLCLSVRRKCFRHRLKWKPSAANTALTLHDPIHFCRWTLMPFYILEEKNITYELMTYQVSLTCRKSRKCWWMLLFHQHRLVGLFYVVMFLFSPLALNWPHLSPLSRSPSPPRIATFIGNFRSFC